MTHFHHLTLESPQLSLDVRVKDQPMLADSPPLFVVQAQMSQNWFSIKRYLYFSQDNLVSWLESQRHSFILEVLFCDTNFSFQWQFLPVNSLYQKWDLSWKLSVLKKCYRKPIKSASKYINKIVLWNFVFLRCKRIMSKYHMGTDKTFNSRVLHTFQWRSNLCH